MLNATPRKYYIPNPIFSEGDDPYALTEEVLADEPDINEGAIKIVATGYVDSETWGAYYFLAKTEGDTFEKFYKTMRDNLSQTYGKPKKEEYSVSTWHVGEKILQLSWQGDSGDGDFYNQIVLEAYVPQQQSDAEE